MIEKESDDRCRHYLNRSLLGRDVHCFPLMDFFVDFLSISFNMEGAKKAAMGTGGARSASFCVFMSKKIDARSAFKYWYI